MFQTSAFAATYGVEPAPELVALARALGARRVLGLAPRFSALGAHNLFERLVTRDQRDPGANGLVEAFTGVVRIGGEHYLELYGWDAPRQVLRFDRETQRLAVVADSLDSFAYAAAVARAKLDGDHAELAARALAGRIAPLEPERRDTEFLLCRSRWLRALLRGDSAARELFDADLNQVVPPDQMRARLAACERFVPTALYSLWRAFWCDESELASYLAMARSHRARLVRDAAALVDELAAGRNELGAIRDVRSHVAAFRAGTVTPRSESAELAWRALDDADAHRALLQRPELATQVATLTALRDLSEHDRRIAIPALAGELAPELEAVMVGSLVRGQPLRALAAERVQRISGHDHLRAALRMTERAIRIAPVDAEIQLAHAMRMIDADDAGVTGKLDALLRGLPALEPAVRVRVLARLADSPRVVEALDATVAAADELAGDELLELGELILRRAPERFGVLALPDDVDVLCALADVAVGVGEKAHALALFEHLLALAIPDGGDERGNYLRALDQARALEAYDIAVRIADHTQPIAHEHPGLFHSAARAYAAVGEYAKALQQIKLAFEHDYARLGQVETDEHLGAVRELPEFKALFLDWHARQDGN